MWAVWVTVGFAVLTMFGILSSMLPAFRSSSLGWRLLSASGIPLGIGGVNFIARFWKPTAGPYRANEVYPYGSHLNAWAVSFGFTWVAFGVLFAGLALLGSRSAKLAVWATLFTTWLVCWLPHGVIGLAFAVAGHNEVSVETYRQWGAVHGTLLLANSLTLLAHFSLSLGGFVLTGREIWRGRPDRRMVGGPTSASA